MEVERLSGRLLLQIQEKMMEKAGKLATSGWTLDVC